MNPYCEFVYNLPDEVDNPNQYYHHHEYGFPIHDDNELFKRLILEINQAGLSWTTILKKQQHFQTAYSDFDIATVATYGETDIQRLLNDAGIIRNRLKINAAIYNAQQILLLQQQYGSFENWLATHHPQEKDAWVKLFKKHFKFVGGEIVGEFLMSIGYLKGAHSEDCLVFERILLQKPKWADAV